MRTLDRETAIEDTEAEPRPQPLEPAGLVVVGAFTVVWSWWAATEGGYFEDVWLPGTMLLCATGVLVALFAPFPGGRGIRLGLLAAGALAALGIWSAASALWSPAADVAIIDGQRILGYALALALGLWSAALLGGRRELALAPLALAGAFAGIVTVVGMSAADDPDLYLEPGGTLEYPLGYRNANAAFFLIAAFPALGLAASRAIRWWWRGPALATATLCIGLAMLSQSRGSVPAAAAALAVYALLSPLRLRALFWLALAVLPALGVLPALLELFDVANAEAATSGRILSELEDAAAALAVTASIALIAGSVLAALDGRSARLGRVSKRSNRAVAIGLALLVALGGAAFVAAVGDPGKWIDERVEEFRYTERPDLSGEQTRFTINAGSERYDLWRVALDDAGRRPFLGEGGGGFQYSYLRRREASLEARDAHSVELELLGELGIPGLALFLAALGAGGLAALRAARAGPRAGAVSAIALTAATYWLVHASVDWFWSYPALTAPTLGLLGAAAGGALRLRERRRPRLARGLLVVPLGLLAILAVPPYLSQRYVDQAFESWRSDPETAYRQLEDARSFNPLNDFPLLAEAAIARASGDRDRALRALRRAVSKRPEEFAGHYLLARLQLGVDRAEARRRAASALELNPLDDRVRRLARRLGLEPPPRPDR